MWVDAVPDLKKLRRLSSYNLGRKKERIGS